MSAAAQDRTRSPSDDPPGSPPGSPPGRPSDSSPGSSPDESPDASADKSPDSASGSPPGEGGAIARLSLAAFASAAGMRLCDPLLPELGRRFGASTGDAAIVVTAFAIAYGLLQAVYGPLGDRFGKYRLVTLATAASVVTALACALAQSLPQLATARLAAGATAAAIIPLSMAWIGDAVPYSRRQPVIARFLFGQILGLVSGQAIGALVAERFGWRAAFVVLAATFATATLLLATRRTPACVPTGSLSTGSLPTGASPTDGGQPPATAAPPRQAGSTRAAFRQSGAVLGRPWARVVLAVVFVEGLAMFGAFAFVAAHLHDALGLSLAAAGGVAAAFGAGGLAYAINAQRLVSRLGERGLARAGGFAMAAAFAVIAVAASWPVAAAGVLLLGLGYYMLHNTLQTQATQMAPESRGATVALFASMFFLGQSIGVAAAARVIDALGARPLFVAAALVLAALGLVHARLIASRRP